MTSSLTALEYVKIKLKNDFIDEYEHIWILVKRQMNDLVEPEANSEFQTQLNELVFPFLACHRAMIEAGISSELTDRYCRKKIRCSF